MATKKDNESLKGNVKTYVDRQIVEEGLLS
jgi:hypothetical protein